MRARVTLGALAMLALSSSARGAQERTVPLTMDAVPRAVRGYPVELGVPFAPGELEKLSITVLKGGRVVPSSATEMVRWKGKRSGVKSALVRFQADLGKKPTRDYSIVFGQPAPEARIRYPKLSVTKRGSDVVVDTGAIRFTVSAKPLVLFGDVRAGGRRVIARSVLEAVLSDGTKLAELTGGKVEIEETGPLTAVIKVAAAFGGKDAGGLGVLCRIHAYAGKPYVKLSYTLIQRAASPVLELGGWRLGLVPSGRFESGRIAGEEGAAYGGDLAEPLELLQDGELTPTDGSLRVVTTRMRYTGAGTGKRAPGWAEARTKASAVRVAVRHFWQQYPKALEVRREGLDVWLHSPKSRHTFKPLVAGWAKTHDLLLDFGAADPRRGAGSAELVAFGRGVRASVPPERYRKAGIFGSYSLPGSASRDHDYVLTTFLDYTRYPHIVHFAFQGSGSWWMEGNLNFGNRMVWNFFMNNTRDSAGRLFMHSLRLLGAFPAHSRYAYDLAEAQARCSMDLHVMHSDAGGKYAGWGPGMIYGHSSYPAAKRILKRYPAHRRYEYYSEPLDVNRTNSRWGPMIHPAGLMEFYLLTGDPRAREVLVEIGDWAVAFQKRGGEDYTRFVRSADGETGLYLWTLMSAYEATGRARYLDALHGAVPLLSETFRERKGTLAGRWKSPMSYGQLLSCLIRLLERDDGAGRLDRAEVTKLIVGTVTDFHRIIRKSSARPARFPSRCSGDKGMMIHAFGYVASLPGAPAWAKEDFRDLVLLPAYHVTHPDEERFEFIRPGCHKGAIMTCSTIEEGTEMFLFSSAETMRLHEKVFGADGLPSPDDPMNAFHAEYQRACRDDPESLIALVPEPPAKEDMGDFPIIPKHTVSYARRAPKMDGEANDECWKRAKAITDFTLQDRAGKSKLETSLKLAYDREKLYVILIAPDLKEPRRAYGRDKRQWGEDGIEIFLDTNYDRTSYWKICLNLKGETSDDIWVQPFLALTDWNPKIEYGRKPGVIELAIPFKEFDCRWNVGGPAKPKGRWSANFCRTGDFSSWTGHNMLLAAHIPQGFGVLEFERLPNGNANEAVAPGE